MSHQLRGPTTMRLMLPLLCLLATAEITHAHHSTAGIFERDQTIEIEGVLTAASWRNPHAVLTVNVTEPNGPTVEWTIETAAISMLRVRGLDPSFVTVGDRIRIAGLPSARGRKEVFANNILLPDGKEVVLVPTAAPRWPAAPRGDLVPLVIDEAARQQALQSADGIFRVWSTVFGDPESFPMFRGGYPLTPRALEKRAEWNPLDNVLLTCAPKNLPYIMITPLPIEFVRRGDDIVLRLEESDVERIIHMAPNVTERPIEHSRFGYSTGRWENDALIVTTTAIEAGYFDGDGTPQSQKIELTETFALNASQDRLAYGLTAVDSETFTAPVRLMRYWAWKPEMQIKRFDCDENSRLRTD